MSAMEHLFMQIFDRKKWIEAQLKHQVESYEESLAFNLLAEGKQPPPWLWSTGLGGGGHPDPKGLNTEQPVSGMLFPLPWATTPSANNSTYFTLPALRGNKARQSSTVTDIRASDTYIFTEHGDNAMPSASNLNSDMVASNINSDMVAEPEAVEASAEFDSPANIQLSNSSQRVQETTLAEKVSSNHIGEKSEMEEYSGRLTWSRDCKAGESLAMNNTMQRRNTDRGRVTRSRSRSATQTDCHDKLSELHAESEAVEASAEFDPLANIQHSDLSQRDQETTIAEKEKCRNPIGENSDKVGYTGRLTRSRNRKVGESSSLDNTMQCHNTDRGRVTRLRSRSATQTDCLNQSSEPHAESEATQASAEFDPLANIQHSSSSRKDQETALVEKEMSRNHVGKKSAKEEHTGRLTQSRDNKVGESLAMNDTMQGHNTDCGRVTRSRSRSAIQTDCLYKFLETRKAVSSIEDGVNEGANEISCRDLEKADGSSKDILEDRMEIDARISICNTEQDGVELLEVEKSESHSQPTSASGRQRVQQDGNGKSSLGNLADEQHSVKLKEAQMIESNNNKENTSNNNSIAASGKECKGSSSDVTFSKLNVLKLVKEASSGGPVPEQVSSINSQLQEDFVPDLEVICQAEDTDIISGQFIEERLETSQSFASESFLLSRSNSRCSDMPVTLDVKFRSGRSGGSLTCSSPDAACVFNSDTNISGHQISISDGSNKRSLGNPIQCPVEEENREKPIKNTSTQPITTVQNAGSVLVSQTDEVLLEDDVADAGVLNVPLQAPTPAKSHSTMLAFRYSSRSSTSNSGKIPGSCQLNSFTLASLDSAEVCLPAEAMGSTMHTKEFSDAKISGAARSHSTQLKLPYLLRSSTRFSENKGAHVEDASVSCSEENPMLPETKETEDAMEKADNHNWITPNCTEIQGASTKARYLLRSLGSHDMDVCSSRSNMSNNHLKRAKQTNYHACERSWPKRRKVEYRSKNILVTSPRLRFKHTQCVIEGSNSSCNIETGSGVEFQPIPGSSETETGMPNTSPNTHCKSLHQSKRSSKIEGPYLKGDSHSVLTALPSENIQEEFLTDLTDETDISAAAIHKPQNHYTSDNYHNPLRKFSGSLYSLEQFPKDRRLCDSEMSSHMHDAASSPHYEADLVGFDDTMPEFEGFSIVFPSTAEDDNVSSIDSNLPSVSLLDQLCKSRHVLTPVPCPSSNYKINRVSDVYQSLPAGFLEHSSLSCSLHFNDINIEHFKETDNGNLELQYRERPYSCSMPSSSYRGGRKHPLTPPVVKFCDRVASGRSGSSSVKVGSNPELICFRIDENSSIADENGHIVELGASGEELVNITSDHQNEPILVSEPTQLLVRGSLESVNSGLRGGYGGNREPTIVDNESIDRPVNKTLPRKGALSLRNRSSKARVSGNINERSRSHGNLVKGRKPSNMPSNIVSNVTSFIPLVRQKQQAAAPLKGRKDIKVKALEAAEAAKRLIEKKQNERELRKAAAKLEREKIDQENIRRLELEHKQKEEERKKKEADVAARKRQREEEGRKEKERKRRCIEETRKQKREQEGKQCAEKVEKKGKKEQRNEVAVEEPKGQLKSEKSSQCQKAAVPNIIENLAVDDRNSGILFEASDCPQKSNDLEKVVSKTDGLQEASQTRISVNKESQKQQIYEMSPYIDSDDEDGEEDFRREKKFIPLWARRECLDQIMISKRHLDPVKIFSRKHSFILNDVLSTRILRRPI